MGGFLLRIPDFFDGYWGDVIAADEIEAGAGVGGFSFVGAISPRREIVWRL